MFLFFVFFFFFNDTATTEIYTLSLHDALPIYPRGPGQPGERRQAGCQARSPRAGPAMSDTRTNGLRAWPGNARLHRRRTLRKTEDSGTVCAYRMCLLSSVDVVLSVAGSAGVGGNLDRGIRLLVRAQVQADLAKGGYVGRLPARWRAF